MKSSSDLKMAAWGPSQTSVPSQKYAQACYYDSGYGDSLQHRPSTSRYPVQPQQRGQGAPSASSSQNRTQSVADGQPVVEYPSGNMAGFGARRLAEESRKRAEEAKLEEERRRRRAYEHEQQQQQQERTRRRREAEYEQEQQRIRQQKEAQYEQQQQQKIRQQQEADARQKREALESQRAAMRAEQDRRRAEEEMANKQASHRQDGYFPHWPSSKDDGMASVNVDRRPAVEHRARSGQRRDHALEEQDSQRKEQHLFNASQPASQPARSAQPGSYDSNPSSGSSRGRVASSDLLNPHEPGGSYERASAANRATLYEDDFEEEEHADIMANFSRYTHYGEMSPSALAPGADETDSVCQEEDLSAARKSLNRATMFEPLPKAKCSDCRQELDFDELADHFCTASSEPGTPLVPQTPISPMPGLPNDADRRSPFFDRYDRVQASGSLPSLSSKRLESLSSIANDSSANTESATMPRSTSEDDTAHSKQMGREQMGLGLRTGASSRSNTSPSSPSGRLPPVSEHSDAGVDASERRRRIEAQREAKRQAGLALSPALGSPLLPQRSSLSPRAGQLELPSSFSGFATLQSKRLPEQRHDAQRNLSGSSSSTASTSLTDASSLLNLGASPVSVSITPSSSFDRFSDKHASQAAEKNLLSPTQAIDRASGGYSKDAQSGIASNSTSLLSASKVRQQQSHPPGSLSQRRKAPKELDLGGIEGLMQDLQASDHFEGRSGQAATRQDHSAREAGIAAVPLVASRKTSSRSAKPRPVKLCCICMCSVSSRKTPSVEKDGRLFCVEDYKQLFLPKCAKCRAPIERDAVKSIDGALKGVFHRSCFSCFACDARFETGVFYVHGKAAYCFEHYSELAGTQCSACRMGIEGICRQVETDTARGVALERYHPRCLTCQYVDGGASRNGRACCGEELDDFFVIGGKRLCDRHAARVQSLEARSGNLHNRRAEKRKTMLRTLT